MVQLSTLVFVLPQHSKIPRVYLEWNMLVWLLCDPENCCNYMLLFTVINHWIKRTSTFTSTEPSGPPPGLDLLRLTVPIGTSSNLKTPLPKKGQYTNSPSPSFSPPGHTSARESEVRSSSSLSRTYDQNRGLFRDAKRSQIAIKRSQNADFCDAKRKSR